MNSKTVYLCVITLMVQAQGLVQLKKSLANSDSLLLMNILESIDAATSDEHLLEVTLKLLKSLCVCMRETIKTRQENYNREKYLKGISEGSSSKDLRVFELHKKIYNNTCYNLREELTKHINKSNESFNHSNCGKKDAGTSVPKSEDKSFRSVLKSKLDHILYRALVETRPQHKYKIKRYNLFGRAKYKVRSSKHTLIVILTLHPAKKDLRKYKVVEEDLHKVLHTNSTIEIDIIDTRYDQKESDERTKPEVYSDCHLQSLYTYLTESERKNLTKVFRYLRKRDTIKIFIEVFTGSNHSDYINICCDNNTMAVSCKKNVINNIDSIEVSSAENKNLRKNKFMGIQNNIKNTYSKLKNFVHKLNLNVLNTVSNNFYNDTTDLNLKNTSDSIKREIRDNNNKKDMSTVIPNNSSNDQYDSKGQDLVTDSIDPNQLRDVSRAIQILHDFVSKQSTLNKSKSFETQQIDDGYISQILQFQGISTIPVTKRTAVKQTSLLIDESNTILTTKTDIFKNITRILTDPTRLIPLSKNTNRNASSIIISSTNRNVVNETYILHPVTSDFNNGIITSNSDRGITSKKFAENRLPTILSNNIENESSTMLSTNRKHIPLTTNSAILDNDVNQMITNGFIMTSENINNSSVMDVTVNRNYTALESSTTSDIEKTTMVPKLDKRSSKIASIESEHMNTFGMKLKAISSYNFIVINQTQSNINLNSTNKPTHIKTTTGMKKKIVTTTTNVPTVEITNIKIETIQPKTSHMGLNQKKKLQNGKTSTNKSNMRSTSSDTTQKYMVTVLGMANQPHEKDTNEVSVKMLTSTDSSITATDTEAKTESNLLIINYTSRFENSLKSGLLEPSTKIITINEEASKQKTTKEATNNPTPNLTANTDDLISTNEKPDLTSKIMKSNTQGADFNPPIITVPLQFDIVTTKSTQTFPYLLSMGDDIINEKEHLTEVYTLTPPTGTTETKLITLYNNASRNSKENTILLTDQDSTLESNELRLNSELNLITPRSMATTTTDMYIMNNDSFMPTTQDEWPSTEVNDVIINEIKPTNTYVSLGIKEIYHDRGLGVTSSDTTDLNDSSLEINNNSQNIVPVKDTALNDETKFIKKIKQGNNIQTDGVKDSLLNNTITRIYKSNNPFVSDSAQDNKLRTEYVVTFSSTVKDEVLPKSLYTETKALNILDEIDQAKNALVTTEKFSKFNVLDYFPRIIMLNTTQFKPFWTINSTERIMSSTLKKHDLIKKDLKEVALDKLKQSHNGEVNTFIKNSTPPLRTMLDNLKNVKNNLGNISFQFTTNKMFTTDLNYIPDVIDSYEYNIDSTMNNKSNDELQNLDTTRPINIAKTSADKITSPVNNIKDDLDVRFNLLETKSTVPNTVSEVSSYKMLEAYPEISTEQNFVISDEINRNNGKNIVNNENQQEKIRKLTLRSTNCANSTELNTSEMNSAENMVQTSTIQDVVTNIMLNVTNKVKSSPITEIFSTEIIKIKKDNNTDTANNNKIRDISTNTVLPSVDGKKSRKLKCITSNMTDAGSKENNPRLIQRSNHLFEDPNNFDKSKSTVLNTTQNSTTPDNSTTTIENIMLVTYYKGSMKLDNEISINRSENTVIQDTVRNATLPVTNHLKPSDTFKEYYTFDRTKSIVSNTIPETKYKDFFKGLSSISTKLHDAKNYKHTTLYVSKIMNEENLPTSTQTSYIEHPIFEGRNNFDSNENIVLRTTLKITKNEMISTKKYKNKTNNNEKDYEIQDTTTYPIIPLTFGEKISEYNLRYTVPTAKVFSYKDNRKLDMEKYDKIKVHHFDNIVNNVTIVNSTFPTNQVINLENQEKYSESNLSSGIQNHITNATSSVLMIPNANIDLNKTTTKLVSEITEVFTKHSITENVRAISANDNFTSKQREHTLMDISEKIPSEINRKLSQKFNQTIDNLSNQSLKYLAIHISTKSITSTPKYLTHVTLKTEDSIDKTTKDKALPVVTLKNIVQFSTIDMTRPISLSEFATNIHTNENLLNNTVKYFCITSTTTKNGKSSFKKLLTSNLKEFVINTSKILSKNEQIRSWTEPVIVNPNTNRNARSTSETANLTNMAHMPKKHKLEILPQLNQPCTETIKNIKNTSTINIMTEKTKEIWYNKLLHKEYRTMHKITTKYNTEKQDTESNQRRNISEQIPFDYSNFDGVNNTENDGISMKNNITRRSSIKFASENPLEKTVTVIKDLKVPNSTKNLTQLHVEVKSTSIVKVNNSKTTMKPSPSHQKNEQISQVVEEDKIPMKIDPLNRTIAESITEPITRKHKRIHINPDSLTNQFTKANVTLLYQLYLQNLKLNRNNKTVTNILQRNTEDMSNASVQVSKNSSAIDKIVSQEDSNSKESVYHENDENESGSSSFSSRKLEEKKDKTFESTTPNIQNSTRSEKLSSYIRQDKFKNTTLGIRDKLNSNTSFSSYQNINIHSDNTSFKINYAINTEKETTNPIFEYNKKMDKISNTISVTPQNLNNSSLLHKDIGKTNSMSTIFAVENITTFRPSKKKVVQKSKTKTRSNQKIINVLKNKQLLTNIIKKIVKDKKIDLKKIKNLDKKYITERLLSKLRKSAIMHNVTKKNRYDNSTVFKSTNEVKTNKNKSHINKTHIAKPYIKLENFEQLTITNIKQQNSNVTKKYSDIFYVPITMPNNEIKSTSIQYDQNNIPQLKEILSNSANTLTKEVNGTSDEISVLSNSLAKIVSTTKSVQTSDFNHFSENHDLENYNNTDSNLQQSKKIDTFDQIRITDNITKLDTTMKFMTSITNMDSASNKEIDERLRHNINEYYNVAITTPNLDKYTTVTDKMIPQRNIQNITNKDIPHLALQTATAKNTAFKSNKNEITLNNYNLPLIDKTQIDKPTRKSYFPIESNIVKELPSMNIKQQKKIITETSFRTLNIPRTTSKNKIKPTNIEFGQSNTTALKQIEITVPLTAVNFVSEEANGTNESKVLSDFFANIFPKKMDEKNIAKPGQTSDNHVEINDNNLESVTNTYGYLLQSKNNIPRPITASDLDEINIPDKITKKGTKIDFTVIMTNSNTALNKHNNDLITKSNLDKYTIVTKKFKPQSKMYNISDIIIPNLTLHTATTTKVYQTLNRIPENNVIKTNKNNAYFRAVTLQQSINSIPGTKLNKILNTTTPIIVSYNNMSNKAIFSKTSLLPGPQNKTKFISQHHSNVTETNRKDNKNVLSYTNKMKPILKETERNETTLTTVGDISRDSGISNTVNVSLTKAMHSASEELIKPISYKTSTIIIQNNNITTLLPHSNSTIVDQKFKVHDTAESDFSKLPIGQNMSSKQVYTKTNSNGQSLKSGNFVLIKKTEPSYAKIIIEDILGNHTSVTSQLSKNDKIGVTVNTIEHAVNNSTTAGMGVTNYNATNHDLQKKHNIKSELNENKTTDVPNNSTTIHLKKMNYDINIENKQENATFNNTLSTLTTLLPKPLKIIIVPDRATLNILNKTKLYTNTINLLKNLTKAVKKDNRLEIQQYLITDKILLSNPDVSTETEVDKNDHRKNNIYRESERSYILNNVEDINILSKIAKSPITFATENDTNSFNNLAPKTRNIIKNKNKNLDFEEITRASLMPNYILTTPLKFNMFIKENSETTPISSTFKSSRTFYETTNQENNTPFDDKKETSRLFTTNVKVIKKILKTSTKQNNIAIETMYGLKNENHNSDLSTTHRTTYALFVKNKFNNFNNTSKSYNLSTVAIDNKTIPHNFETNPLATIDWFQKSDLLSPKDTNHKQTPSEKVLVRLTTIKSSLMSPDKIVPSVPYNTQPYIKITDNLSQIQNNAVSNILLPTEAMYKNKGDVNGGFYINTNPVTKITSDDKENTAIPTTLNITEIDFISYKYIHENITKNLYNSKSEFNFSNSEERNSTQKEQTTFKPTAPLFKIAETTNKLNTYNNTSKSYNLSTLILDKITINNYKTEYQTDLSSPKDTNYEQISTNRSPQPLTAIQRSLMFSDKMAPPVLQNTKLMKNTDNILQGEKNIFSNIRLSTIALFKNNGDLNGGFNINITHPGSKISFVDMEKMTTPFTTNTLIKAEIESISDKNVHVNTKYNVYNQNIKNNISDSEERSRSYKTNFVLFENTETTNEFNHYSKKSKSFNLNTLLDNITTIHNFKHKTDVFSPKDTNYEQIISHRSPKTVHGTITAIKSSLMSSNKMVSPVSHNTKPIKNTDNLLQAEKSTFSDRLSATAIFKNNLNRGLNNNTTHPMSKIAFDNVGKITTPFLTNTLIKTETESLNDINIYENKKYILKIKNNNIDSEERSRSKNEQTTYKTTASLLEITETTNKFNHYNNTSQSDSLSTAALDTIYNFKTQYKTNVSSPKDIKYEQISTHRFPETVHDAETAIKSPLMSADKMMPHNAKPNKNTDDPLQGEKSNIFNKRFSTIAMFETNGDLNEGFNNNTTNPITKIASDDKKKITTPFITNTLIKTETESTSDTNIYVNSLKNMYNSKIENNFSDLEERSRSKNGQATYKTNFALLENTETTNEFNHYNNTSKSYNLSTIVLDNIHNFKHKITVPSPKDTNYEQIPTNRSPETVIDTLTATKSSLMLFDKMAPPVLHNTNPIKNTDNVLQGEQSTIANIRLPTIAMFKNNKNLNGEFNKNTTHHGSKIVSDEMGIMTTPFTTNTLLKAEMESITKKNIYVNTKNNVYLDSEERSRYKNEQTTYKTTAPLLEITETTNKFNHYNKTSKSDSLSTTVLDTAHNFKTQFITKYVSSPKDIKYEQIPTYRFPETGHDAKTAIYRSSKPIINTDNLLEGNGNYTNIRFSTIAMFKNNGDLNGEFNNNTTHPMSKIASDDVAKMTTPFTTNTLMRTEVAYISDKNIHENTKNNVYNKKKENNYSDLEERVRSKYKQTTYGTSFALLENIKTSNEFNNYNNTSEPYNLITVASDSKTTVHNFETKYETNQSSKKDTNYKQIAINRPLETVNDNFSAIKVQQYSVPSDYNTKLYIKNTNNSLQVENNIISIIRLSKNNGDINEELYNNTNLVTKITSEDKKKISTEIDSISDKNTYVNITKYAYNSVNENNISDLRYINISNNETKINKNNKFNTNNSYYPGTVLLYNETNQVNEFETKYDQSSSNYINSKQISTHHSLQTTRGPSYTTQSSIISDNKVRKPTDKMTPYFPNKNYHIRIPNITKENQISIEDEKETPISFVLNPKADNILLNTDATSIQNTYVKNVYTSVLEDINKFNNESIIYKTTPAELVKNTETNKKFNNFSKNVYRITPMKYYYTKSYKYSANGIENEPTYEDVKTLIKINRPTIPEYSSTVVTSPKSNVSLALKHIKALVQNQTNSTTTTSQVEMKSIRKWDTSNKPRKTIMLPVNIHILKKLHETSKRLGSYTNVAKNNSIFPLNRENNKNKPSINHGGFPTTRSQPDLLETSKKNVVTQSNLVKGNDHTSLLEVTDWWLDDMYLKVRLPLPINSNPGMVFPRRHFAKMEEVADLGALFIDDILDYKEMLDRGELPLERATSREKGQPLCMEQFYRLLGVCRIPEVGKDRQELPPVKTGTEEQEELVVVACRNYFYPIPVKAVDRGRLTPGEIQAQLLHAMVDAAGAPPAPRVGLLTAMNRDQWARAREHLIKDEINRMNLDLISRALCILCLDEAGGDRADTDPDTNAMLRAMHGAGTRHHSANRWFDKTVQLIISSDGTVGMCYEHSAAEGVAVVRLAERALARAEVADRPAPPPALLPAPQAIKWNIVPEVQRNIEQAARDLDRAISDLDFKVYTYRGYGREFMKSCRTSPDVYIQLAIQYAYYKMYGYLVTTYESASLRRFRQGRVDNIRSAHAAALSWAAAMCTAETSPLNEATDDGQKKVSFNLYGEQKKLELFEEAARKQTSIMEANILGKGIDNHLLALREMARETLGEVPPVFCDDTYKQMFEFKMSTSQVATTADGTFMGYGAVCPDGYGCCYNPKKDSIIFCISSFTSSSVTNTEAYRQSLEEALDSMKLMFQARKVEN